jgi:hypothetical protein
MCKSNEVVGKIIPMFLNRPFMKDSITEEVLTHWEDLRRGRLVPRRSDIDPRKLRSSLNYTFILEANSPDNIRFRLVGSKLCDCMGMEMRGMPAYSMVRLEDRNDFNQTLQHALAFPEILDFQLAPKARMVLLPMSDEADAVCRMLGCITTDPADPNFPTRFQVQSVAKIRIIAAKSIKPQLVLQLAENQKTFRAEIKKAARSGPPHLKIVK